MQDLKAVPATFWGVLSPFYIIKLNDRFLLHFLPGIPLWLQI